MFAMVMAMIIVVLFFLVYVVMPIIIMMPMLSTDSTGTLSILSTIATVPQFHAQQPGHKIEQVPRRYPLHLVIVGVLQPHVIDLLNYDPDAVPQYARGWIVVR